DLKPANILIRSKDGVAKVTDFGIARPEGEANRGGGNTTKGIIGSAHYMAPEQVKGLRDLDRRVDIYALGIMLFQMLTGRVPFDSDNTFDIMRQQIEEPLPSITPGRPDLPPQIDGILQQACAKDRENRFPTCEAFLQRLAPFGQAAAGAPGPTIPAGPADLADTALGAAYPDLGPLMPQDGTTPGLGGGMANPGVTPPTPVGPSGPVPTVAQPMVQAPPGYMMGQAPMGQAPMGQAPMPQTPMPQTPMPMGQPGPMPNTPMPMMGPPGAYGPPTGAMPAHGTITGGASALPPSQPSSKIWIFPAVGAVLFAGVLTLLFTSGVIGGGQKETLPDPIATDSTSGGDEGGPEPATTNPGKPSAPAGDLSHYEGMWVAESGRELRATVVGDRIEFQVVTPSQFAPQPYNAGEARFVLHPVPDEKDHFTVEDRIRPVIPAGYVYDSANARTTCLAVFKEVSATPLKAEVNGDRLDVEFAKVEPTLANFALAGKQIMSCRGLEQLRASKIPGVFHKKG
ncbi:MAG: protein kinase, partial [Myxococcales bacterium]|nr:protein kinase [Myxococcales bacterium]